VLGTIRAASAEDVDEAYRAAAAAQPGWASRTPAERQTVLLKAADILQSRREEMVRLLVAEWGSTIAKAELEVTIATAITLEATSFPHRAYS